MKSGLVGEKAEPRGPGRDAAEGTGSGAGADPDRRDREPEAVRGTRRPVGALMLYYAIFSLVVGPLFPLFLVPRYLRYRTLRYEFDAEGVSMRYGALFRREIYLSYDRIQDIHLTSNAVERWLGLTRVQVQTASGSAKAEMVIEGLPDFERVRNFLYSRMPGTRDGSVEPIRRAPGAEVGDAAALRESLAAVTAELRALRLELASRREAGDG